MENEPREETSRLMGYLASRVEERIVEYVLRGTGVTQTHITIDQLDKAVSENFYRWCRTVFESQEQVDKAKDNWDWLEEAINMGSFFIVLFKHFDHGVPLLT